MNLIELASESLTLRMFFEKIPGNTMPYPSLLLSTKGTESSLMIGKLNTQNYVLIISAIFLIFAIISLFFIQKRQAQIKILDRELALERAQKNNFRNQLDQFQHQLVRKEERIKVLESDVELKSANLGAKIADILSKKYLDESDWAAILLYYNMLKHNFSTELKQKFPLLKTKDVRLLILIDLGYSNKGIAQVYNITVDGVKKAKSRLLKKIELDDFPKSDFIYNKSA